MPKITNEEFFGGADSKIQRLNLTHLYEEIKRNITGFKVLVCEEKDSNGSKTLRVMFDEQFERAGWILTKAGGVDWRKCLTGDGITVCIGVELQISGRSDMLSVDIIHLKQSLERNIDVGVLVVPNDRLGSFMTDRTPRHSDLKRHIKVTHADDLPLVILAFEHDGPGPPLPKQKKKRLAE